METNSKKEVIKKIYKFVIQQFKDPVFAVALSLSVFMWFLNSLAGNFTTVVSLPVKVLGAIDKVTEEGTTEKTDNLFSVDCKVSGKGYKILLFSLFSQITINTAEIKVEKSHTGEYVIDIPSLESKMNEKLNGITLINIFQKRLAFKTLTYSKKEVPVMLNANVKNDGQFMQVGDAVLEPSHISISANISKLDSINEIFTDYIWIENKEKNISGEVGLVPIPGVTYSTEQVYYAMSFQRFTEKRVMKRVEVKHADDVHYSVIPSHVEVVFNVAEDIYQDFNHFNFPLYIDIRDKNSDAPESMYIGDNKFLIKYNHLPKGVKVREINPKYVTILKGTVEGGRRTNESSRSRQSRKVRELFDKNEN